MKKLLIGLTLVASLLAFAACSSGDKADGGSKKKDDGKIRIALITKMVDSPYWQTVKKAAEEKAAELGNVEVVHMGPPTESDIDKQVQIVENAINDEYDGIILAACDKDALVTPVQSAEDAGIPVVMIDSGISEETYDAFLATDNQEAGAQCAKAMAELIGGKGEIAVVNFAAGTQTAVDRETGFNKEIKDNYPDIKIVGVQYCDSDPTKAANQATDFISANPKLKGIWGANDQAAVGVAQAVQESSRKDEIKVVGFDNSDDIKAGLEEGKIQATAVQMPSRMGSDGVQLIQDILDGKDPSEKNVDTGVTMVTTENLKDADIQKVLNQ